MRARKNVKLSGYSNYKIGGPAEYFFEPKNIGELQSAIKFARDRKLPILILGGGTNLLINDSGFKGVVVHPFFQSVKTLINNLIEVDSGVSIKKFLSFALKNNLSGWEWAGGLPGTMGGAIRGNAGCFGGETKDSVASVKSVRISDGKLIERKNKKCLFGYRQSIFKKNGGKEIIVSAVIKMKKGNACDIKKSIQEKINYRRSRHPMEYPNIGSTFKNIPLVELTEKQQKLYREMVKKDPFPVVPVACVISRAGVAGKRVGGAMISPKHPNFIVNLGGAKAKDVEKLIALVKKEVWRKFRIRIEEEIIRV
ncbi:MAG: UDP-N-acetylmuramate dehydrogenase [Candidatus Liptonbacteria bacterium]